MLRSKSPRRLRVVAVDPATGKERWTWFVPAPEHGFSETTNISAREIYGGYLVVRRWISLD